jgi:hypothetical protein
MFTKENIIVFIETRKYPKEFLLLFKNTCTKVPEEFILPDYEPSSNFKGKISKYKNKKHTIIKKIVPLIKSENAWDPKKEITTENEKILKKINGTLNKLSELNFNKLSEKINEMLTISHLEQSVVDLIYTKCINEPNYIELYTRLIKCLNYTKLIIMKCQYEFKKESNWNCKETCKLIELSTNEIDSSQDEQYNFRKNKLKKQVIGNLNLIVSLYKFDLFSTNIIEFILNSLVEKSNESDNDYIIEMLCYLLKNLTNFKIDKYKKFIKNIQTKDVRLQYLIDSTFN